MFGGVVFLWAALAMCGIYLLQRYAATPVPRGQVPLHWPDDTRLTRTPGHPVLVMFAHAEWTCTRATLAVLDEIAREIGRAVDLQVVIDDDAADPARSEIALRARGIEGVTVVIDRAHAETARFGAITSGHTVLYAGNGNRLFVGGLTDARGHSGPSVGRAQVTALVRGQRGASATPVFGCELGALPEIQP
jgi:hypothetical protein